MMKIGVCDLVIPAATRICDSALSGDGFRALKEPSENEAMPLNRSSLSTLSVLYNRWRSGSDRVTSSDAAEAGFAKIRTSS